MNRRDSPSKSSSVAVCLGGDESPENFSFGEFHDVGCGISLNWAELGAVIKFASLLKFDSIP